MDKINYLIIVIISISIIVVIFSVSGGKDLIQESPDIFEREGYWILTDDELMILSTDWWPGDFGWVPHFKDQRRCLGLESDEACIECLRTVFQCYESEPRENRVILPNVTNEESVREMVNKYLNGTMYMVENNSGYFYSEFGFSVAELQCQLRNLPNKIVDPSRFYWWYAPRGSSDPPACYTIGVRGPD